MSHQLSEDVFLQNIIARRYKNMKTFKILKHQRRQFKSKPSRIGISGFFWRWIKRRNDDTLLLKFSHFYYTITFYFNIVIQFNVPWKIKILISISQNIGRTYGNIWSYINLSVLTKCIKFWLNSSCNYSLLQLK
jgi:hypothetical protein